MLETNVYNMNKCLSVQQMNIDDKSLELYPHDLHLAQPNGRDRVHHARPVESARQEMVVVKPCTKHVVRFVGDPTLQAEVLWGRKMEKILSQNEGGNDDEVQEELSVDSDGSTEIAAVKGKNRTDGSLSKKADEGTTKQQTKKR